MYAVMQNHENVVRTLLLGGANPNLRDKKGICALMTACDGGKLGIVRLLLQNKADPNQKVAEKAKEFKTIIEEWKALPAGA